MAEAKAIGGITLGLFTTLLSAIGLALQKRGHAVLAPLRSQGVAVRSWTSLPWRAGLSLLIVSSLLSIAVTALLGQALASSMAACTIVWSLIIVFLGGAPLTIFDFVSAFLCVCGTVAVVLGRLGLTAKGAVFLTAEDVKKTLGRMDSIVFGSLLGAATMSAAITALTFRGVERGDSGFGSRTLLASRLFLAGAFGAFTGVASKGFSTILAAEVESGSPGAALSEALFWVFLLALISSVVCQMAMLGGALKLAPLIFVVPYYQCSLILGGALCGIFLWNETLDNPALFAVGVAVTLSGLIVKALDKQPLTAAADNVGSNAAGAASPSIASEDGLESTVETLATAAFATSPFSVSFKSEPVRRAASAPAHLISGAAAGHQSACADAAVRHDIAASISRQSSAPS